jgi:hypothetical protein
VPGRPELNAMNTPLVMNATQTVGAACAATGAIAQDGSGAILSCQGGSWKLAGDGKCVATTQDLNQLQADGRCYNGVALANSPAGADWVFVEVYRHYNPAIYYLVQRATGMTGASVGKVWSRAQNSATQGGGWSAWAQQADAQVVIGGGSGSVSAAGNIVAGATVQGTHVYSSGNVAAAGNVQGNGVYGNVLRSYGDSQTDGNASALANTINHNGAIYNVGDSWAFQGLGPGWAANSEPQVPRGSLYVNDVYIRAVGKWASQLATARTLVGYGSVSGQDWIYVYPPPGASAATHRIYAHASEFNQCSWEQAHQSNWAFEMGDAAVFLQGSALCPGWSTISYMSFAVPR